MIRRDVFGKLLGEEIPPFVCVQGLDLVLELGLGLNFPILEESKGMSYSFQKQYPKVSMITIMYEALFKGSDVNDLHKLE